MPKTGHPKDHSYLMIRRLPSQPVIALSRPWVSNPNFKYAQNIASVLKRSRIGPNKNSCKLRTKWIDLKISQSSSIDLQLQTEYPTIRIIHKYAKSIEMCREKGILLSLSYRWTPLISYDQVQAPFKLELHMLKQY